MVILFAEADTGTVLAGGSKPKNPAGHFAGAETTRFRPGYGEATRAGSAEYEEQK